jgi:hypothetical protein
MACVGAGTLVLAPWSHGAAAYAINRNADSSLELTVHFGDLHDPAGLNAALSKAGGRTVVMAISAPGACRTPVVGDPKHSPILHIASGEDPGEAWQSAQPWLSGNHSADRAKGTGIFTIHPDLIPAGDQLLVTYRYSNSVKPDASDGGEVLQISSLLVAEVPPCVPSSQDAVVSGNGIGSR